MSPIAGLGLMGWGSLAVLLLLYWLRGHKIKTLEAESKTALALRLDLEDSLQSSEELRHEESIQSQSIIGAMRVSAKSCAKDIEALARAGADVPAIRHRMLQRFARIVRETGDPNDEGSG